MKDYHSHSHSHSHRVHKHRHGSEERGHKKCRRKKEKHKEQSRSREVVRISRSRSPSRTRSSSSRRSKRPRTDSEERKKKNGNGTPDRVKEEPGENGPGRSTGNNSQEGGPPRWGKNDDGKGDKKPMENKAKPDFGLSGKLAEEVNTYKGVVIKYSEPPEARMPKRRWRLYPFKGDSSLPTLYVHRQSAYLIGRDRIVADIPIDHPSCSKQHAVLQYRVVPYVRENGTKGNRVRPYIIDLESANGTFVNNKKIESRKYVELLEKDVIKFAFSSREYVVLHEHSKDEEEDDNVTLNDE